MSNSRKFKYIKDGKVEGIYEEKDEEEMINDVLRWNNIEIEEVFEDE